MSESPGVHRTVGVTSALTALLIGLLVIRERPSGWPAALALVLASLLFAAHVARGRQRLVAGLLFLTPLFGYFVFGFSSHPRQVSLRLVQVTVVALYGATLLSAMLGGLRRLRPWIALVLSFAFAGGLLFTEAAARVVFQPSGQEASLRDEWTGLLATRRGPGTAVTPETQPWRFPSVGSLGTVTRTDADGRMAPAAWDTRVLPRPKWSGRATPDPDLGLQFSPHTTIRTLYRDNPRGYFERADYRRDIWEIDVAPGSAAQLVLPAGQPDVLRIAITEAQRNVPPWHIMLNQAHLRVVAGVTYRLEFRARADRIRTAVTAVTQAVPPFDLLGFVETIKLSPEWKPFRIFFTPEKTERDARIHFALGGDDASVEVSDVVLQNGSTVVQPDVVGEPWTVSYRFNALGCRGTDPSSDPAPVRRILLLGDGFTMGVGVHERDTFAAQLQRMLDAGASPSSSTGVHEVMNCGIVGYGSREEQRFYERLAPQFQSDIVVVVLGLDDDRTFWELGQRAKRGEPLGRWAQVSRLVEGVEMLSRAQRTYDYSPSVSALLRLRDEVESQHGRLVVVVAQTTRSPRWSELRATVAGQLKGSGIQVLDVGDALVAGSRPEELIVHQSDPHPNERVHTALARRLAPYLQAVEREMPAGVRRGPP